MQIERVKLANFRCHQSYDLKFKQPKTAILGPNGSGKTSILEAIYIGLQGKSFKATDRDLVRDGEVWYRIDLKLASESTTRQVKYQTDLNITTKKFIINNQTTARLPLKNRYPIVLFEPDDLNLISGSPTRRRRYLDNLANQIYPHHNQLVNRYNKILKQRNSLISRNLKMNHILKPEDLFSWNVLLSQAGAMIIKQRLEIIRQIQAEINQIYYQISQVDDSLLIKYSTKYSDSGQIEQQLFKQLSTDRQNLFQTAAGPHRDDLIIKFNNCLACNQASRGENRSLILSLKLIEVALITKTTGVSPIILLDDVLSELDQKRRQQLLNLNSDSQLIITSTDDKVLSKIKDIEIIKL